MGKNIEVRRLFPVLCLCLFLAACRGSSEMIDGSDGPSGPDTVARVVQRVVLPAIDKLASVSPVNQPAPPRMSAAESGPARCGRFDPFCFSGGFELCAEPAGGPVTFRYEHCDRPVGEVDGFWVLDQNGLSATADLELSIDDLALSGRIGYVLDDVCWESRFDSFAATGHGIATTLDGVAGYCLSTGSRHGKLDIAVAGVQGSFELTLEFDGGAGTLVAVHDAATTLCSVDMRAGTATCRTD